MQRRNEWYGNWAKLTNCGADIACINQITAEIVNVKHIEHVMMYAVPVRPGLRRAMSYRHCANLTKYPVTGN
jgi:hypothetical protein